MSLKIAFGWSIVVHLGLMIVRPPPSMVPPRQVLHPLEVSYLPAVQVEAPSSHPAKPVSAPSQRRSSPVRTIPPSAEEERPRPKTPEPPKQESPDVKAPENHPSPSVDLPPTGNASAASLPEGEFAAIEHKEWVRQHLKAHLKYPAFRMQGTVRLQLVLAPYGVLKEVAVVEASDPRLADLAVKDAQAAIPYPRFPKEMKQRQVRYEFLVKYQPE